MEFIAKPPGMMYLAVARALAQNSRCSCGTKLFASLLPLTWPRDPPTASSSSMKMTAPPYVSDCFLAFRNRDQIRRLPTPMNMLENEVPLA